MPYPASSTLFPYTTLFRSAEHRRDGGCGARHENGCAPEARIAEDRRHRREYDPRAAHEREESTPREREEQAEHEDAQQDRKSTRLNSSHMSISYAVFCLKK